MAFGGRHTKLIGGGQITFTQGAGAGDQVSLADVLPYGLSSIQTISLMWARISFLSVTPSGTARTVSIFGESLGSITTWPTALDANKFVQYRFPSAQAAVVGWIPIINPLPSAIFTFGAGGTSFAVVGYYEIWASGTPIG